MSPLLRHLLVLALALSCGACAMSETKRGHAEAIAIGARATAIDCDRPNHCAIDSPLRNLADTALAESANSTPHHFALLLDRGPDALMARVNLIRSARYTVDLQTYIFDEDDTGHLVLDELLAAARRGVKVRMIVDQLSALRKATTLAALSSQHANLELRVYNPIFNRARISYPQYLMASICCWHRLNQRMHSKLLLVDDAVGITGGRNYQDDYYDWSPTYDFRDRDVLVAGPVAREMASNFDAFWESRRSVPAERLDDVGRALLSEGPQPMPQDPFDAPARVEAMSRDASDAALVRERLVAPAMQVGAVRFLADLPQKHRRSAPSNMVVAGQGLREIIEASQKEVLLQTPYLVLSDQAQDMFRALQARPAPPRIVISTNSLAATDAFIAYALSFKYKRRYLREFGFHIYEFKPFPATAPIDLASIAAGAEETKAAALAIDEASAVRMDAPSGSTGGNARTRRETPQQQREHVATRYFGSGGEGANAPVPLRRAGVRIGLHAKSMVVDERIAVIGTHNFDPRGDRYNTESAVVIDDPAFARLLADSIRGDMRPENAWVIARRDPAPVFSGLDYSLAKVSEALPLFDLWPWKYATSYEFAPGPECPAPLPRDDPGFRRCYTPVGPFPEVNLSVKGLTTRIFTAFGAGLAPIL
ncbi:phospholipase D family protein [Lysobacter helvus]|uniref:Phospholipase D family protein n=2 Tax=Lysobacteraceae TaxID=32033 RepID=A0ABM7Q4S1_9GAMM|nr:MULTISPECIES: phospholipase D family protein [Lysobacter]BCT92316.1 phospholipase D family protein [Lysobacter caseinilyticus]BCT95469.1 phospholipase D family protein [Lysobacter helvus]